MCIRDSNITWVNKYMRQPEMLSYINLAKRALMLTRRDTQGVMACELATYGIPLITSDLPICREIFVDCPCVTFLNNSNMDLKKAVAEVDGKYMAYQSQNQDVYKRQVLKNTFIGGLLGVFLIIAVVLVRYLMDDTVKTPEDVEKYLQLSTLAVKMCIRDKLERIISSEGDYTELAKKAARDVLNSDRTEYYQKITEQVNKEKAVMQKIEKMCIRDRDYIRQLGEVNCRLGRKAEEVWEVVYGIPLSLKKGGEQEKIRQICRQNCEMQEDQALSLIHILPQRRRKRTAILPRLLSVRSQTEHGEGKGIAGTICI